MRGLLKTGGPGKPPVRPKGQKDLQGKNMRESSDYVGEQRLCGTDRRYAYYGSAVIIFIIRNTGSPNAQLCMPEFSPLLT